MPAYLVDHDVNWAGDLFPGEVDKGRRSDDAMVRDGCRNGQTIVTANAKHFVQEILKHQRQHAHHGADGCSDCYGLVILPSEEHRARNAIKELRRRGLRAGKARISFDDVWDYNLCVSIHGEGTTVRRFPRCRYRENDDLPNWYTSLSEVGTNRIDVV